MMSLKKKKTNELKEKQNELKKEKIITVIKNKCNQIHFYLLNNTKISHGLKI